MRLVLEQLYSLPAICPRGVDDWANRIVEQRRLCEVAALDAHWSRCGDAAQEAIAAALGISQPFPATKPAREWLELPAGLRAQYEAMNAFIEDLLA